MRKLLFIINPKAGKKLGPAISEIIRKEMPAHIPYQVVIWKDKEHFEEIISLLHSGGYSDAVAAGGDGTVNRVAQALLGTNIRLGIIPLGSGNGLARSLGLSMDLDVAVRQVVQGRESRIDSGTINGMPFFCTAGLGFDAHIGSLFASSARRGLQSYVRITLRELFRYRAQEYSLEFGEQTIRKKAFLVTVANAGQYGNDFYIAPQANMRDGLFHVVILKPFNVLKVAGLLRNILGRKAFVSKSIETYSTRKVTIHRASAGFVHYDGEPMETTATVVFENYPLSLNVIVGEKFTAA